MTVSVNTNATQTASIGTEHTLATITAAGVYSLMVDLVNMADAATPDALEIREYMKPASGGTERLVTTWYIYGRQSEFMFLTPPRMSAISIKYTLKQTQGTGRNFDWSVQQSV